ncbi:MAG: DUF6807 family protein, partial [Planctomycetota bacterium]|nr:DUF6807 family protein [Planctomycetota bacterium]
RFTERAVAFIERNRGRPFFLYVAHPMPHVPLHVSDKFQGATEQGLYGDVIAEIDWSVGEILTAIRENGIDERTLVIFTSDNGPWLSYGDHAGSPGPLREGKGTTFEGGVRVPCIMRWPGRIPPGRVCAEPVMTIDIFPTVAELIGAPLPDHVIDGKSILTLMTAADGVRSPHEALFFYYHRNDLEAMRSGRWKLHFPHRYRSMEGREPGRGGTPGKYDYSRRTGLELYDLSADIGESKNVADAHPDVVERLVRLAEAMRADLGDALTNTAPTGAREPGRLAPARVDEPEGATKHEGDGSATAALSYRWVVVSDGVVDLMDGDQRVLRYMHAYDASTPERLHETYKCYHHVFDARGEHVLTKGPGGLYTHHRGLFIGWNRLTVDGREYDFWHMKGVTQRHAGMLELLAGPEAARQTALIHWCDGEDKIVIAERRTVRVTRGGDGAMLVIGFRSELTAERDDVLLLGDPEHAGFQFRAHNDVAEGPPEVKAKYLFHEKDVDPRKETDLPWAVMSFGLNGKRYWVQHMNHPRNPSPTVYSAYRDYGRFGAYPRTEIEAGETLILRYRLRIGEGDAPTRRALAQSYETYRQASAASSGATGGDGR